MKKILFAAAAALMSVAFVDANAQKFGHINSQNLMQQLDEFKAAQTEIQEKGQKLQTEIQTMAQEFEGKLKDYQEQQSTMSEVIRAAKEQELQQMDQRLQQLQQLAQQEMQQTQMRLVQPLIEKMQKAIDEVGKEQGFIYIFDLVSQVVLYHSEGSVDAEPFVLAKLQPAK